jgi:hypothetical protein
MRANPDKLVHHRKTTKNGPIANVNMASQLRVICKYRVICDLAVVGQMHIGHDPVVIADPRNPNVARRSDIEGTKLANSIAVSNH